MKMKILFFVIGLISIQHCSIRYAEADFYGFWEGPHPEDENKKFYVHLMGKNDSVEAKGYWTANCFYESQFKIDSVQVISDSLRFFVPDWNCYYSGRMSEKNVITGGFSCPSEPFDSVRLVKKEDIRKFLTEAKPGCLDKDYQYLYEPPDSMDAFMPSSSFQTKNDALFIDSLMSEIIDNRYGRINSFLLAKEGCLICEEYFYGYTKNDLHQIESSTKSIASLLIGIARDRGMLSDIQEPLYKLFPQYDHLKTGAYRKITLAHVLSMTSGFSNEYEPYLEYDRIDFSLKRDLVKPVGAFNYDGGNTEILGAVIKLKSGEYADVFAEKYLFRPLGIETYDWHVFKQNGFPCMGGSLEMRPRDMVKIGMLVLNHGQHNNQQIVSSGWIEESTSFKTKTHIQGDDYGYQWWVITLESNHKKYETIWANGFGGQFIYIIPELNVVIVTTGHNYEYDSWAITRGISKHLYLLND